ncbi:Ubiquitin carboxyl-terminal hydrolase 13 [Dissostichus eleginoides]|uniref:Ubiquitin carboxyl-terminal hydrolase 13 n=1 Tax=Dissostichus eleginoides TaxID=100907 RepID=A0AAD9BNQ8_DISEL|nr:Ubiquitin carboxyl-terminal hydrolase 13 [Dissostichus eleginoides]
MGSAPQTAKGTKKGPSPPPPHSSPPPLRSPILQGADSSKDPRACVSSTCTTSFPHHNNNKAAGVKVGCYLELALISWQSCCHASHAEERKSAMRKKKGKDGGWGFARRGLGFMPCNVVWVPCQALSVQGYSSGTGPLAEAQASVARALVSWQSSSKLNTLDCEIKAIAVI